MAARKEASPPPKPGPEKVGTPPGSMNDRAEAVRVVRRLMDPVLKAVATPGRWTGIVELMDKLRSSTSREGVDRDVVRMLSLQLDILEDRATLRQRAVYATVMGVSIFSDLDTPLHLGLWRPRKEKKPPPEQRTTGKTRRRLVEAALKEVAKPAKKARRDNLGRLHVG